ncbi:hypothetical protein BC829DRAFT_396477 [Chytridium lagenaria]|nr:hypothetical protein BC829DRAFT_396477 [Chytridium lagenaria]
MGQPMMQPGVVMMQVSPMDMCPSGGIHQFEDEFTCCGIFLAICFFPIGVLCCWMMRTSTCAKCGTQRNPTI